GRNAGREPIRVELGVDRVRPDLPGVEIPPDPHQTVVVLAPAQRARAMPRGERGRLVEEEQLREAARLHEWPAMPIAELEPAGDPALAVEPPADPPRGIVEAAPVPVHQAPGRIGHKLAERRHAVLERRVAVTVARGRGHPGEAERGYRAWRSNPWDSNRRAASSSTEP